MNRKSMSRHNLGRGQQIVGRERRGVFRIMTGPAMLE
jgi:hypothetical protein